MKINLEINSYLQDSWALLMHMAAEFLFECKEKGVFLSAFT